MKEKEKKLTRILRIFMTLLTCILITLFFGIMVLVSDMQGTARVVNYAGLVRGKTQQIIKLENAKIVISCSNKKRGLGDSKYNERRSECETALAELH